MNGILLLDKPTGMTSNAALQKVKHLLKVKKAGHTGSLDPLASGMLPLCLGEATKFSQFLLEADKIYQVTAKLGIKTNTGDAEGEIISQREISAITQEKLLKVMEKFRGAIEQIPSMYSALKHKGQPLYKLARQGITVERKPRTVHIHELILLSYLATNFSVYVRCSKGTYIRTLIEDIGEVLGCGAHVTELRRLMVGTYAASQMITLCELETLLQTNQLNLDKHLLPLASTVAHWPEVRISEAAAFYLRRGQPVIVPQAPTSGWVKIILHNGNFLGVGEIMQDGRVAPRRLVQ